MRAVRRVGGGGVVWRGALRGVVVLLALAGSPWGVAQVGPPGSRGEPPVEVPGTRLPPDVVRMPVDRFGPPTQRRNPPGLGGSESGGLDDPSLTSVAESGSEVSRGEEHSKLLRAAQTIGPLGTGLFGETVNLFTGSTEFRQADVSIAGHVGPSVSVGRRFVMEDRKVYGSQYLFADWDVDLPYLSVVGPETAPWRVDTGTPTARCTSPQTAMETRPPLHGGVFTADDYWQGISLSVGGEVVLSTLPSGQRPGSATVWRWGTKGFWFFSCLSSLKNAGQAPGYEGEGFLGVSPDGTKYWFDWMGQEQVPGISKPSYVNPGSAYQLLRRETRLYPSRIEDRFGNWVAYDWQGDRLVSIRAWDGRRIDLGYVQFDMGAAGSYDSGYRVSTVSDGLGTWRYHYDAFGRSLVGVDRPDGSRWTLDLSEVRAAWMTFDLRPDCQVNIRGEEVCDYPAWDRTLNCSWMQKFDPAPSSQRRTARMTHPSGAVGTFVFQPMRHGRSRVEYDCLPPDTDPNLPSANNFYPVFSDVWALITKQVSGPGLVTDTWQYSYSATSGGYVDSPTGSEVRTATLTHPDGSRTEHTFGTVFQVNEGQALQVRVLAPGGAEVSRTETAYTSASEAQMAPFPESVGYSGLTRGDAFNATALRQEKARTISQQGEAFVWRVSNPSADYDVFGNPTRVDRFSSLGFSRTDQLDYHHNTALWVLNQLASVRESSTGLVEQEVEYDGRALPIRQRAFGQVRETLGYHPDGSLASATDGNGNGVTWRLSSS